MFIQDRIKDVEKELIKAEEALKYYRETNTTKCIYAWWCSVITFL